MSIVSLWVLLVSSDGYACGVFVVIQFDSLVKLLGAREKNIFWHPSKLYGSLVFNSGLKIEKEIETL